LLHAGPEDGEQAAERVELAAAAAEQSCESRELARVFIAALRSELGRVLGDSAFDALALRIERECAGIAVGEGVLETCPARIVPTLQASEEQVDPVSD
jgi:hypothetical protein